MPASRPKSELYAEVAKMIEWLDQNADEDICSITLAKQFHRSPEDLSRLFREWVGVGPKRFLDLLRVETAREQLRESASVLEASFATGLSGPSRLHDLMVRLEGVSPGEFRGQGEGLHICYALGQTPFGQAIVARTPRGICALRFVESGHPEALIDELKQEFSEATFQETTESERKFFSELFTLTSKSGEKPKLHVRGTNFQIQVWRALLLLPPGYICSYQQLANWLGKPKAVRAVAGAVARNPVAYLIPCHRVIRSSGVFHRYRWGRARKQALLAWEQLEKQEQDAARA